jgi:hypothetical protein
MSGTMIPKEWPIRVEIVIGDGLPVLVWVYLPPAGRRVSPVRPGHSLYWRSVQDLPWRSIPVRWQLRCRKFWCDTPGCPQRVVCDHWPTTWRRPHQQRTEAVWAAITPWGGAASAADVARVATQQGLPVSADTVLRALRAAPDPPVTDVRVVGIDEWAPRQGRTDATIVWTKNGIRWATCSPMTSRRRWRRGCGPIRRSRWSRGTGTKRARTPSPPGPPTPPRWLTAFSCS